MQRKGIHHGWVGLALMLVAFQLTLNMVSWKITTPLAALGLTIFIDDFVQHIIQQRHPAYRSPINRLYGATLWRLAWVRWINERVDELFGRR
jgi:branched-subunit amino acid ABC-type transport system permease component